MTTAVPNRIVVLGVGNLIMGDEGVGIRCVEHLEAGGRLPPGVVTIDGGTSTHELLADLENLELLVIVDAVVADGPPGTVVRLEGDHIPSAFSNKLSPHQHGINDLLANLRLLGRSPQRLVLLGVTPHTIALGMELSAVVAAALPDLEARVLAELAGTAAA
jgi:hydrogenase maturation protease